MLKITYEKSDKRFCAYEEGLRVGVCTYETSGKTWIVTSTEVDPDHRGRGIAAQLVDRLAREAEKAGVQIVPMCSYARRYLSKK